MINFINFVLSRALPILVVIFVLVQIFGYDSKENYSKIPVPHKQQPDE